MLSFVLSAALGWGLTTLATPLAPRLVFQTGASALTIVIFTRLVQGLLQGTRMLRPRYTD